MALDTYLVPGLLPSEPYDGVARRAAQSAGAPVALLSFIGRDDQWVKAGYGTGLSQMPRRAGLCHHTLAQPDGSLAIGDAATHPVFGTHELVGGPPYLRSYAGASLIDAEGYALGTLCVMDTAPSLDAAAALPALRALATEVTTAMAAHRAAWTVCSAPPSPDPPSPGREGHFTPAYPARHGVWLGVRTEYAVVGGQQGRRLVSVAKDSPACRAGLRVADTILSIDGRVTRRRDDIVIAMAACVPGQTMRLCLIRAGRPMEVLAQAAGRR